MVAKLFVLGSPGSGKSTVVRCDIEPLVKDFKYSPAHINDYEILRTMFLEDLKKNQEDRWFAASEHNGFNVLNFIAFDEALQRLEGETATLLAQRALLTAKPLFALIEFSRNDYQRAFQQFSAKFLQDAYFIYLDTTIENCKRRIHARIEKPNAEKTENDYYVSDYIFEAYYKHEENVSLIYTLETFGIDKAKVLVVNNNVPPEMVSQEIQMFGNHMMQNIQQENSHQEARESA